MDDYVTGNKLAPIENNTNESAEQNIDQNSSDEYEMSSGINNVRSESGTTYSLGGESLPKTSLGSFIEESEFQQLSECRDIIAKLHGLSDDMAGSVEHLNAFNKTCDKLVVGNESSKNTTHDLDVTLNEQETEKQSEGHQIESLQLNSLHSIPGEVNQNGNQSPIGGDQENETRQQNEVGSNKQPEVRIKPSRSRNIRSPNGTIAWMTFVSQYIAEYHVLNIKSINDIAWAEISSKLWQLGFYKEQTAGYIKKRIHYIRQSKQFGADIKLVEAGQFHLLGTSSLYLGQFREHQYKMVERNSNLTTKMPQSVKGFLQSLWGNDVPALNNVSSASTSAALNSASNAAAPNSEEPNSAAPQNGFHEDEDIGFSDESY